MSTAAKGAFLEAFEATVLQPRGLDYRVQFTGPTGANAVEAALKLARKVTRPPNVIAFTRGYHGLSLGALAATGQRAYRDEADVSPAATSCSLPYDGFLGAGSTRSRCSSATRRTVNSGLDGRRRSCSRPSRRRAASTWPSARWLRGLARSPAASACS